MSHSISADTNDAIGVFGGSFDPVHLGHLRAALELAYTFDLRTVLLIPNGHPPHRPAAHVDETHRLKMLELAIENSAELRVDLREVQRQGKSYSYDTLSSLRAEFGRQRPIIFGLGADAFASIKSWHRADELLSQAHLAVLSRPGSQLPAEPPALQTPGWASNASELLSRPCGAMYRLEMTPLSISSTRIREQIAKGWSPRFLLPESVCEYIQANKLYQ